MKIVTVKKPPNLIIEIIGDIDHHSADEIRDEADKQYARSGMKNILFDFSGVSFMDSSGIGMIMGRYKSIREQGGRMAIACMNSNIKRIYAISGLERIIPGYGTVEEAEKHI